MAPHFVNRGFTLLELMIAIAVLAILLGVGVPAFGDVIRNNQISAASTEIVSALTLARNEAMKRGVRVSLCPAATADTCATGDAAKDWNTGWILFADDFGDAGTIDAGDVLLQNWSTPAMGVTVVPPNSAVSTITFTRRARAESARELTVSKKGCSGNQRRVIKVDTSGRVSLTREAC